MLPANNCAELRKALLRWGKKQKSPEIFRFPEIMYCCNLLLRFGFFRSGDNRNNASVALSALEAYSSVSKCEEGVIAADAHVLAGIVHCAALAYNDVAGFAYLAAEDFNA